MSRSRTPPHANTQLPPRAPPAWVWAGPPAHLSFSHSPPLCNNASHHYILTWRAEILRNHISGWLLWQAGNLKVACRLPVPLVNIPLPLQQPRFGLPCSRSHTLRPRSWPRLLLCRLGYQFSHYCWIATFSVYFNVVHMSFQICIMCILWLLTTNGFGFGVYAITYWHSDDIGAEWYVDTSKPMT